MIGQDLYNTNLAKKEKLLMATIKDGRNSLLSRQTEKAYSQDVFLGKIEGVKY